jgi:endonuclease YncB( thermonuclease family)
MKGTLQVTGSLSLFQFWPEGKSDADTSRLELEVNAFSFQPKAGSPFQKTSIFENAIVHGRVTKPVLSKGKICVRWQGLDSPELHFMPQSVLSPHLRSPEQERLFLQWNYSYRQALGETSTLQLRQFLERGNEESLPCRVVTHIDEPNDAFDCYGRLVGDVLVTLKGKEINLNHWLLQKGWAFPAFYDSMSKAEITLLSRLYREAEKKNLGVWAQFSEHVQQFNWAMRFRKEPEPEPNHLRLMLPKLFRRHCTWAVNERAGLFHGGFRGFLKAHPDLCYQTDDFLKNGHKATVRRLEEFLLPHGFFAASPQDLVFREFPAQLKGPHGESLFWRDPTTGETTMTKKKEVQAPKPLPIPNPKPPKPGQPIPSPLPPSKPPNPGPTNPPPAPSPR